MNSAIATCAVACVRVNTSCLEAACTAPVVYCCIPVWSCRLAPALTPILNRPAVRPPNHLLILHHTRPRRRNRDGSPCKQQQGEKREWFAGLRNNGSPAVFEAPHAPTVPCMEQYGKAGLRPSRQHHVVTVYHFRFSRIAQQPLKLGRWLAAQQASLGAGIVGQPPRKLYASRVAHRNHITT